MKLRKCAVIVALITSLSITITSQAATLVTAVMDNVPVKASPDYLAKVVRTYNKGDTLLIENSKSVNGWYQLTDSSFVREEYIKVDNAIAKPNYPYQNTIVISTPVYMQIPNKYNLPLFPGDKVSVLSYEDNKIKIAFASEIGFIPITHMNQVPIITQAKQDIINYALQWVGNPYVYGGNSLVTGTDCSGFVKLVYQNFGIPLERSSIMQYLHNGKTISITEIDIGDLIFYGNNGQVSHVAIYIGEGKVVHSGDERTGISVDRMLIGLPIIGIKRIY